MIEYLLSSTEESRFREVKTRLPYLISLQFSGETESSMFRALFLSQLVQAHCHFWHTVFLGKDFITATWMNTHYTLRMCSLNTWVFLSLNDGLTNKFSTLEFDLFSLMYWVSSLTLPIFVFWTSNLGWKKASISLLKNVWSEENCLWFPLKYNIPSIHWTSKGTTMISLPLYL